MSLQSAFVIALFEPARLKAVIDLIEALPIMPASAHGKLAAIFEAEKAKYLGVAVAAGPSVCRSLPSAPSRRCSASCGFALIARVVVLHCAVCRAITWV